MQRTVTRQYSKPEDDIKSLMEEALRQPGELTRTPGPWVRQDIFGPFCLAEVTRQWKANSARVHSRRSVGKRRFCNGQHGLECKCLHHNR
ncbi:hypothetical protein N7449_006687 [Penicillium cf. viridicatum]|uniref:Uncharacterized protein n=1 Tax=Penicillium cf. viridicatum TaxID=2972119 RepID=A0A9W9MBV0_9EURO|nr:hypothetical protein N7449_006687 [Penicillium cf. viridicatum]